MSNTPSSAHESTLPRTSPTPAKGDIEKGSEKADNTSQLSRKSSPLWKKVISYLIAQWLVFGLGLAILLAWAFPSVGKNGGSIRAEYSVKWGAIALIFLITGLSLSTKAFLNQALNFHLHIVTQFISFIIFSAVVYGVVWSIVASGNSHLDKAVIGGIITMGVLPTTLASNVAMTRNAGGNVESATAEVVVGNVIGTFITPSLLSMYLKPLERHGFIQPDASGKGGLSGIYIQMAKQLSACLFAPLIVGQVIQNLDPLRVKRIQEKFKFSIISQILMVILVWSTFCNQFATGVFTRVSKETIILVAFLNVALYLFMSFVCLYAARPPFPGKKKALLPTSGGKEKGVVASARRLAARLTFGKKETAAVCFCGAAKGLVLGAPLISIMYSAYGNDVQAAVTVPIALYQGTQIAIAQFSVKVVRHWIEKGEDEDELTIAPLTDEKQ